VNTPNAAGFAVEYRTSPPVTDSQLDSLFAAAWPQPNAARNLAPVLARSLGYVCAYAGAALIGFVNVAWDGGFHAFLLDTTVHPDFQRRGIGTELVRRAAGLARSAGVEWLHVDYEPHLAAFYLECGFRPTDAGLMRLNG
jgi:GNAT superfamily N-acetyltransferase